MRTDLRVDTQGGQHIDALHIAHDSRQILETAATLSAGLPCGPRLVFTLGAFIPIHRPNPSLPGLKSSTSLFILSSLRG
jgi:hypothetical protein